MLSPASESTNTSELNGFGLRSATRTSLSCRDAGPDVRFVTLPSSVPSFPTNEPIPPSSSVSPAGSGATGAVSTQAGCSSEAYSIPGSLGRSITSSAQSEGGSVF